MQKEPSQTSVHIPAPSHSSSEIFTSESQAPCLQHGERHRTHLLGMCKNERRTGQECTEHHPWPPASLGPLSQAWRGCRHHGPAEFTALVSGNGRWSFLMLGSRVQGRPHQKKLATDMQPGQEMPTPELSETSPASFLLPFQLKRHLLQEAFLDHAT